MTSLHHTTLKPYGYTPSSAEDLPPGASPARVIRHDGASLLAITPQGTCSLRIPPRLDPQPTVGDWLALEVPAEGITAGAHILGVLPRTSLLRRQSSDGVGAQALAANVDVVLITCGIDRPIRAGRISRIAAQAWDAGATPVLVLTKAADPHEVDLPRLELEHPGMRVLATSALEQVGLDEVRAVVAGCTAVLLGESGAGKSTLTNALLGSALVVTGAVRSGDAKGRHTTTARQLHRLPGESAGVIIDTPGIRAVGLFTDTEAVDASFAEIGELGSGCRFTDCQHDTEPGCAVLGAIESGLLPQARYDSWRRLQKEVASAALRSKPHEMRKQARQFSRSARAASPYFRP